MEGAEFPALTRTSLAEATAELIRERILLGTLEPGVRLVEAEIARQLRTSRAPVREALAMLRAEGLTREDPGRGTFVTRLEKRDIEQIYELRASLESGAAHLLIERGEASAIAALEEVVDRMRAAAARGDRQSFIDADLALHEELCRRCGNERLYRTWEGQTQLLRTLIRLEVNRLVASFDPVLGEHERLVAEIRSGDPARASAAAWQLFRRTSRVLTEGIEDPTPRDDRAGGPPGAALVVGARPEAGDG